MRVQLRHKEYGLFQGLFLGMGLWYPMSNSPEQGIFAFENKDQAKEFIRMVQGNQPDIKEYADEFFTIELYDNELNTRLMQDEA
jgi:hypothetical protein